MKDRLEHIYSKVKSLIDSQLELKKEIIHLREDLEIKNNSLVLLSSEKENLENKLNFYTLAPESLNKKEIKQKIDQYIEEIDNCIKMLDHK